MDHELLQVNLTCLGKTIKLVLLCQLNDFNNLCARGMPVRSPVEKPLVVIKVNEIDNLPKGLIADITPEVNN